MNSRYQSTIRIFVFLGLALICLEVFVLTILSPWLRTNSLSSTAPAPLPAPTNMSTAEDPAFGFENTGGKWILAGETVLPSVTLKEYCRGQFSKKYEWEQKENYHCVEEFKLTARRMGETKEYELLSASSTYGMDLGLEEAKQLGAAKDPNARLLLLVSGLNDCGNEMKGCGYNYTLKVTELHQPDRVQHLADSEIYSTEESNWNRDFTNVVDFLGFCDPVCRAEPVYVWNIKTGIKEQLTQEVAYLNEDQYQNRTPDAQTEPYLHWGTLKWIDLKTVEIELIDSTGAIKKLRRTVK